ncbi:MAG: DUF2490 domain-containing protein [Candidatus Omnitrophica bacterium]|nr:DUF2490 domain-containing protein [Candidatus Omnitrophota bacterium]
MRRRGWRVTAILILMAVVAADAALAPPAQARDDWRLWLEQQWSLPLSPDLKLVGKSEERFQADMSDYHVQVASIGVSWKLLPWLKLEPMYHYQWTESPGNDTNENRLFLNATPSWSVGPLRVEDRHRVEFRHINGRDDWRYRNKPKLSLALGCGWWAVESYVADEVFYGARVGEWNRNRLFLGLKKRITAHVGAELYYLLESDKTGRDWDEFHVVGVVMDLTP